MRILLAHNSYLQPGGEDVAFAADIDVLRDHGHDVVTYCVRNEPIASMSRISLAGKSLWNRQVAREVGELVRQNSIDVAHFHNTFPLMSPAAVASVRSLGVPVVQTVHNFRLLCPNAQLLRDDSPCEACASRLIPWPSMKHACYRGSRMTTAVVALSNVEQRLLRHWGMRPDVFVTLTEDVRQRLSGAGINADTIMVRPNFLQNDPGVGSGSGGYALFVGRLAHEKGIKTLLNAWELTDRPMHLKIVGDGPLRPEVVAAAERDSRIEFTGRLPRERVLELMKEAAVLVLPSLWYEVLPIAIVESYAVGTPVIASGHGAMRQLVWDGQTGLHVVPNDPADLAYKIITIFKQESVRARMRVTAREEFERHFTAAQGYTRLMEIYQRAQSLLQAGRRAPLANGRLPTEEPHG